jgi:DNA-binding LacI/PurR family transcriptional regulator
MSRKTITAAKKRTATRTTSADVARASGVSQATVSYVLNNDPRQSIPPETRERVLRAARSLGYHPFAPARILRAGYSRLVLIVVQFERLDPKLARDLDHLEAGLTQRGYTLIWHVGAHIAAGPTHPSANLTPAVVISCVDQTDPTVDAFLQQFGVPVLSMNLIKSGEAVGRLQVTHLAKHGKRRMVFAAPERPDVQNLAKARLEGVRRECAQLGLQPPLVKTVPLSRSAAGEAMVEILAELSPPFGICSYNDEVAFAILAALSDAGVPVPDSVAVIGCDDIPLSEFSVPPLTTIAFDNEEYLAVFIENVLAASRNESVKEPPEIPLSVSVRESA